MRAALSAAALALMACHDASSPARVAGPGVDAGPGNDGGHLDAGPVGDAGPGDAGQLGDAGPALLWVPSCDSSGLVYGFSPDDLVNGTATVTVSSGTHACLTGLAFDHAGKLWAGDVTAEKLLGWTLYPDGGTASPIVLNPSWPDAGTVLSSHLFLAFAPNGDLYVADFFRSVVHQFATGSLQSSGSPTPVQTLQDPTGTLAWDGTTVHAISDPVGLGFDPAGNLWIANQGHSPPSVSVWLAQDGGGVSSSPFAILYDPSGQLLNVGMSGLAFDPQGNPWISEGTQNNSPQDYAVELSFPLDSGVSAPVAVALASAGCDGGFCGLSGIAFDPKGSLWGINYYYADAGATPFITRVPDAGQQLPLQDGGNPYADLGLFESYPVTLTPSWGMQAQVHALP
jgi:hypothetical protein